MKFYNIEDYEDAAAALGLEVVDSAAGIVAYDAAAAKRVRWDVVRDTWLQRLDAGRYGGAS